MDIQEFFKDDRYAALSGIELVEVKKGWARTKMHIREMHLNAGNVVQGGAIFTLVDLAFAAAVNSYGNLAVSIQTNISYFKGVASGILYAEASLINLHKRLASFRVEVINEKNELIADFTGTAYRKDVLLPFEPFE